MTKKQASKPPRKQEPWHVHVDSDGERVTVAASLPVSKVARATGDLSSFADSFIAGFEAARGPLPPMELCHCGIDGCTSSMWLPPGMPPTQVLVAGGWSTLEGPRGGWCCPAHAEESDRSR